MKKSSIKKSALLGMITAIVFVFLGVLVFGKNVHADGLTQSPYLISTTEDLVMFRYFNEVEGETQNTEDNDIQVASINENTYASFADAYNQAEENDIITLLADIDQTNGGNVTIEKDVAVNLNGHIFDNIDQVITSVAIDKFIGIYDATETPGGVKGLASLTVYGEVVLKNVRLDMTEDQYKALTFIQNLPGYTAVNIKTDGIPDDEGFITCVSFLYEPLVPQEEKLDVIIPGDKEEALDNDELTVDTNAQPVVVKWYYDDDNNGTPDDLDNPVGEGETYKIEMYKDKGHRILAVVKQELKQDGRPYPKDEMPEVLTKSVKVAGELVYSFKVGEKNFTDIKMAFNACSVGDTILLIRDYNTTELPDNYLVINKDIVLDVNGFKLSIAQNKISLDMCALYLDNSNPQTGGLLGIASIDVSNSQIKLFNIKTNLDLTTYNDSSNHTYRLGFGYEILNINEDGDPDVNGFVTAVEPGVRKVFEDSKNYTFETATWFKTQELFSLEGVYSFRAGGYYNDIPGYKFAFISETGNPIYIDIVSARLDKNPTSIKTMMGTGTQENPFTFDLGQEYVALDTTKVLDLNKTFVNDGDVLKVITDATNITVKWYYDDDYDGIADSSAYIGMGKEYTIKFVDLADSTHNDQGHNIIAYVTQNYDKNGCEYSRKPTSVSTTARVSRVFPVIKALEVGKIYLKGDYINITSDVNIRLENTGEYSDVTIKAGSYAVPYKHMVNNYYVFLEMFKLANDEIRNLYLPFDSDTYTEDKVIGIRLVSGTGALGDPYVFELVYDDTYVELLDTEDIVINTQDGARNPKNGDELSIYTTSNPINIEWFYDDDFDGLPDDPTKPLGRGKTYVVKCPDLNDPSHDDTGHNIIAVIKQTKKSDGTDYGEGEAPTITTEPVQIKGKVKPVEVKEEFKFGDAILLDEDKEVYTNTTDDQNKESIVIKSGEYIINKPDTFAPNFDTCTFNALLADSFGNPIDLVIKFASPIDDIKKVIGVKCVGGSGTNSDPYLFVAIQKTDLYIPLSNETKQTITGSDHNPLYAGDEIEASVEATRVRVEWFYDDDNNGIPDSDTPIATGNKFVVITNDPNNPGRFDIGHNILPVFIQDTDQNEQLLPKENWIIICGTTIAIYKPLNEESEIITTAPDKKFLETGDEITLEIKANPISVKWYYDDNEDGIPDNPEAPLGEGLKYIVKDEDANHN